MPDRPRNPFTDLAFRKSIRQTSADGVAKRIHAAIDEQGLSHSKVAEHLGITKMWVYDLESDDGDLPSTISLKQVCDLAELLELSPRYLVCGREVPAESTVTTPDQIAELIRIHMATHGTTSDQLSETIGWDVHSVLEHPERMWTDWCIDQLQDVCKELGIDWRTVLPPSAV